MKFNSESSGGTELTVPTHTHLYYRDMIKVNEPNQAHWNSRMENTCQVESATLANPYVHALG